MGYWDEYCLVCGGPPGDIDLEDLAEQVLNGECSTDLGTVSPPSVARTLLDVHAKKQWLTGWVGVDSNENVIELGEYSGQGDFATSDGGGVFNVVRGPPGQRFGIAFHRSCRAVLAEKLDYQPRYSDTFDRLGKEGSNTERNLLIGIDYGAITRCFEQDFDYVRLIVDGNVWMLDNPLLASRNQDRIVTMWSPFVRFLSHRPR